MDKTQVILSPFAGLQAKDEEEERVVDLGDSEDDQ